MGAGRPVEATGVVYLGADSGLAEGLKSHLASQGVGLMASSRVADAAAALRGADKGLLLMDGRAAAWHAGKVPDLAAILGELAPDGPPPKWVCISDAGDLATRLAALRGGALACYTRLPTTPELAARLLGLLGLARAEPYRVLVVDDQKVAAVLTGGMLNRAGMVVRIVVDPLTVLDALDDFRPDLIVMDLHMPGANGIELTTIIREHDELFAVPIVMLSVEGSCDRQMQALRGGADEFLVKPVQPEVLVETVRRCIELARSVRERQGIATPHDPMTGLWGRGYLLQRLDRAIVDGAADGPVQGLLYINIDPGPGLDAVYRRGAMGAVMVQLGQVLLGTTGPSDVAARIGKHSFAILVRRRETGLIEASAEGLRAAIAGTSMVVGELTLKLTASIGLTQFQPGADDAVSVVTRAKTACSTARTAGGNRVTGYTPALPVGGDPAGGARVVELVREALHGDGFRLLYHPMVPVQQRPGERYEAVLRLRTPEGELMAPSGFLLAAADAGLMPDIDRWVMSRALDDIVTRSKSQPGLVLMVRQTLTTAASPEWAIWLRDELGRRGLARHRPALIFDVDDVMAHRAAARACFGALKLLGIDACLSPVDDSPGALEVLALFPWSMVRLSPKARTDLSTAQLTQLVATVHERGAQVIATGIEDSHAIARVWGCGVDFIQGHFIQAASEGLEFDFAGTELL